MKRRELLKWMGVAPLLGALAVGFPEVLRAGTTAIARTLRRVRPGEAGWPSAAEWEALNRQVGGRLMKLADPLAACRADPAGQACGDFFQAIRNPYYILDHANLTQTSGWVDAWTSKPSAYAVAAESAADVAAAVNFAREHKLRLVVKGAGHSYQGTSDAPDSLLVWTHPMQDIVMHDAFVPQGCAGKVKPQPAVSVGAGQIWGHTYEAVTPKGGRYVQGGGCLTVGVAGLVSSGGFGSWSKRYGTAASSLLEAEVVTADGKIRTVNACNDPDLFWALKGGGGGSFGVITRLTLRTHELPKFFGVVNATIESNTDDAYRRLIARFVDFYREHLFNAHWGETVHFTAKNHFRVSMAFQGLDKTQAEAAWKPFFDFVKASPKDYKITAPMMVAAAPARAMWNPEVLRKIPGVVVADSRPNAPLDNIVWAGDAEQSGMVLTSYASAWLPQSLLQPARQKDLVDALFAFTREFWVELHCNKGLAGGQPGAVAAARDTATNPQVMDAFALAIAGSIADPAFPGIPGHEPDVVAARKDAKACTKAMQDLYKIAPDAGSYVSESDFFLKDWQRAFWGSNYPRLLAVKTRYDPDGLFTVHHGVGSEDWSADGFTRVA
ncbi:MAG: FAD-binding oxidoreductase [Rhodanobacteraceae bacterium]|nr:MAG: FAD-binding oxidoreductase [Rhodanobacteraceae bacterium]